MGGYGSGRWPYGKSDAKTLVEDCRVLDIRGFLREKVVRPNHSEAGRWIWSRNGEEVASVSYVANTRDDCGTLRLYYQIRRGENAVPVDHTIRLVTSPVGARGGRRWLFACTACRNGGPTCGRRAAKLYLPAGGKVFACRRCYDLAYQSNRESRKWDSMVKVMAASTGLSIPAVRKAMRRIGKRRS